MMGSFFGPASPRPPAVAMISGLSSARRAGGARPRDLTHDNTFQLLIAFTMTLTSGCPLKKRFASDTTFWRSCSVSGPGLDVVEHWQRDQPVRLTTTSAGLSFLQKAPQNVRAET
jgi:hypothetical protein